MPVKIYLAKVDIEAAQIGFRICVSRFGAGEDEKNMKSDKCRESFRNSPYPRLKFRFLVR